MKWAQKNVWEVWATRQKDNSNRMMRSPEAEEDGSRCGRMHGRRGLFRLSLPSNISASSPGHSWEKVDGEDEEIKELMELRLFHSY